MRKYYIVNSYQFFHNRILLWSVAVHYRSDDLSISIVPSDGTARSFSAFRVHRWIALPRFAHSTQQCRPVRLLCSKEHIAAILKLNQLKEYLKRFDRYIKF